jgi:hypothetical protein
MADRYCRNCGHELAEGVRFCTNCGTPVQEAAHVPTPEADTAAPPPPMQQTQGTASSEQGKVSTVPYWIAFVVLAVLAIVFGDDGTLAAAVGVILATVWVYKDAKSRGMDAGLWVVGMILLAIVAFPLYFFKRKPRISGPER